MSRFGRAQPPPPFIGRIPRDAFPATSVSLVLTLDGSTPWASQIALEWAFYDQAKPSLFTGPPVAKGSAGTTNGSGLFTANITGSTLAAGGTGYLIVSNTDGTVTQGTALRTFSAPAQVS